MKSTARVLTSMGTIRDMIGCAQGCADDSSAKMATVESLAVLLTLQEASENQAFSRQDFGLSEAATEHIARVFVRYAFHACAGHQRYSSTPIVLELSAPATRG